MKYRATWRDMEWVVIDSTNGAIKGRFGRDWYSKENALRHASDLNGDN